MNIRPLPSFARAANGQARIQTRVSAPRYGGPTQTAQAPKFGGYRMDDSISFEDEIYEVNGKRYLEKTSCCGPGVSMSSVQLDENDRPIDDDGWPMEYVNGRWERVDMCK